ncbi:MAG: hypothetical protein NZ820_04490, partial [Dehalococcoidia bacterium]|nr:hypothetical protein [Dehalococcoidia bacterium]
MTDNRIAFVFAISFAVLALFLFSGAKAATPTLNDPYKSPDDPRVDGATAMLFGITYNDVDGDVPNPFTVVFDGVSVSHDLVCTHADCGTTPNGFWRIADGDEP